MRERSGGPKEAPEAAAERDPAVRIVAYDPAWPQQAARELARVAAALGELAVRLEHVGSTSVPGLAAKPIVDLQVSVAALEPQAAYVQPLERLGYLFVPFATSPEYHFFGRPPERPRTHHLHVCLAGSREERRHLAVPDYLRAAPEEAARYAAVKRESARLHPEDRIAYMEGKDAFVAELERRALAVAKEL
ncbi:MAG TPA: GrpB family protein [Solirubrobacterales bacterium]|nr:GrpB family protein [Solirubrobacterales bacterium]